ncbi:GGDEF domain-containing protein [uncultured Cycloclasticus sp.]|uniref:GGDEF domain-containing protein n=1 Tax=uncultured Cycloclasticus sp. TaxID=172194 RepID=UPI00258F8ED7|nr:GGDEF domain-containing protein [uncultured Cycloclasticus sp.]
MTHDEKLHYQSLLDILATDSLTPLFQPIISMKDNKIYGYEGLIRGPSNGPLHSPINLFNAAAKYDRLAELDLLCRKVSIQRFGELNLNARLFINTIPEILLQKDYQHGHTLKYIKDSNLDASQVVIELTEQYPIEDYDLMASATKYYQDMGFSIAIDDLGAGYSGLRTWSEIKPDFVKIDRHFLNDIHNDINKQKFVQSIVDIAKGVDCKVIAEGIELRGEYLQANAMAIDYAQGFYFARPNSKPTELLDCSLFSSRKNNFKPKFNIERSDNTAAKLLFYVKPIYTHTKFYDIGERFQSSPELTALPVLNDDATVAGVIWRTEFLTIYASRYGKELNSKKNALSFLDVKALKVDITLSLNKISQLITSQNNLAQHDDFIITSSNRYKGMGKLLHLLKEITEMQITFARHMNPLSNLPGNVPISQRINHSIETQQDIVICYFDLDNFKPYNDTYGFGEGDKVLRKTAKLLAESADTDIDFVGHVGGDDFIIIFQSSDWQHRCNTTLNNFSALTSEFYSQEHLLNGGISALDRNSEPVFYPLLSISIGALRPHDFGFFRSENDLVSIASNAKSAAKKIPGNSLYQIKPSKQLSNMSA